MLGGAGGCTAPQRGELRGGEEEEVGGHPAAHGRVRGVDVPRDAHHVDEAPAEVRRLLGDAADHLRLEQLRQPLALVLLGDRHRRAALDKRDLHLRLHPRRRLSRAAGHGADEGQPLQAGLLEAAREDGRTAAVVGRALGALGAELGLG